VNDQFSSFLDRKQTNYLPNAKGKKKLLLCKKSKEKVIKKKNVFILPGIYSYM
jgi:hypothetical protein